MKKFIFYIQKNIWEILKSIYFIDLRIYFDRTWQTYKYEISYYSR
jgi:hypothetical protein